MTFRSVLILAAGGYAAACDSGGPSTPLPPGNGSSTIPPGFALSLEQIASGVVSPVLVAAPPGDSRIFIVEQQGTIRILENGELRSTPFLDIRSRVTFGGERGLLGLAFHPQYESNGYFYVNFTASGGATRVERFVVSASDPNIADPGSASLVLSVAQPFTNHNGGMITFAPDGMLLIAMGDGGSGGDPLGHGQNRGTLLGSLLRIDVSVLPYSVPGSNPYVGEAGVRPEIWAYGLRNPWRFSVDRATGTMYIADVGQGRVEEVNAVPVATPGVNYGWKVMEGDECYQSASCNRSGLTLPVLVYGHNQGCSVTGGYVYRGAAIPEIAGHYFYSDYCGAWLRSFRLANGQAVERREWDIPDLSGVTSFGEDGAGELYMLTQVGGVYRLVRKP